MAKKDALAARVVSISNVAAYHDDATSSLRMFFSETNPHYLLRFFGKNRNCSGGVLKAGLLAFDAGLGS